MAPFGMTEIQQGNTGLMVLTALFMIGSAAVIATNRSINREARRTFLTIAVALGVISVIDWFNFITDGVSPELSPIHTVLTALVFTIVPALAVALSHAVFPERHADSLMAMLVVIHALIQAANIPFGFVFWYDESGFYHRGPLYALYAGAYTIASLYLAVQTIRGGRTHQSSNISTAIVILSCTFLGVGIQVVFPKVQVTWTVIAMALMLYFSFYCDMILRCDPLTRLLNRRSFDEFADDPQLPCSVIVLDVDDFKHVNDTYGHAYGDECLIVIAHHIWRIYGNIGRCYRTGGDEFCVIATENPQEADSYAPVLRKALDSARRRHEHLPTVSIGHAIQVTDIEEFSDSLMKADKAMYLSKEAAKEQRTQSFAILD